MAMQRKPYQIIFWMTFKDFLEFREGHFEIILQEIAEAVTPVVQRGRPSITPEKKLLITLWYISHQDTVHRMGDRFNVTDSSMQGANF
jgi:hypothetical protein